MKNFSISKNKISYLFFSYLTRDIFFVFTLSELYEKINYSIRTNNILRLKFGIDPTGKIHLGHAATIQRIKEFLMYIPNSHLDLIIGDATILFSSPDRKKNFLTTLQINENCNNLIRDLKFILRDFSTRVTFHRNGDWFSKLSVCEFLPVLELFNVNDILKKFKLSNLNLASAIYPALQSYDSVYLKSDIEFGGSDQLCSVLVARETTGQIAFLTNLLPTSKGEKMSKSSPKSAIFINDEPQVMFKKLVSLSDENFLLYMKYLDIKEIEILNFKDLIKKKLIIAKNIISTFCSNEKSFLNEKSSLDLTYCTKLEIQLKSPKKLIDLISEQLETSKKILKKNWPKIIINDLIITDYNLLINNNVTIKIGNTCILIVIFIYK